MDVGGDQKWKAPLGTNTAVVVPRRRKTEETLIEHSHYQIVVELRNPRAISGDAPKDLEERNPPTTQSQQEARVGLEDAVAKGEERSKAEV